MLGLKRALAYQALYHTVMDTPRPDGRADQRTISAGSMSPTIS